MTAPVVAVGTDEGRPDFGPEDVDALADDLLAIVGPRGISSLPRALERAARDGSGMSPILSAQDLGRPDLVCYPRTADAVPHIVRAAVARGAVGVGVDEGLGGLFFGVPAEAQTLEIADKAQFIDDLQKALYAAKLVDEADTAGGADAANAALLLDVLTPIVKSWPSMWGPRANDLAIQILGGAGYTRDHDVVVNGALSTSLEVARRVHRLEPGRDVET